MTPERIQIPIPGVRPATTETSADVTLAGAPDGAALVFHSGTPSGPAVLEPLAAAAESAGFRYVSIARPGYGRSTENPRRRVADVVPDTLAVLDELGIGEFSTLGWSGGGPHALACGALAADRCLAVVVLAGVAPQQAEGLDWLAGMGAENVEEFAVAQRGGEEFEAWLAGAAEVMLAVERDDLGDAMGDLVSAPDLRALSGPAGDYLAASMATAFECGVAGWRDDDVAFLGDWGFDVSAVATPVLVVQGTEDRMVPATHGDWLAANVPGAEFRRLAGHGHISLWDDTEEYVAWLQGHLGAR